MRKWKGDPLMTAQDLSRKSGEYRRRAFIAEVEALKKESACSAEALSAYAERALNGGLKRKTAQESEAEAHKAGKAARDRVLTLAGYDPLLPDLFLPADIRIRAKSAYETAGTRVLNPLMYRGDPIASPLATDECTSNDLCCRTATTISEVCGQQTCCAYGRTSTVPCCFLVTCDNDPTNPKAKCFTCP
jgi:hypothetical protein